MKDNIVSRYIRYLKEIASEKVRKKKDKINPEDIYAILSHYDHLTFYYVLVYNGEEIGEVYYGGDVGEIDTSLVNVITTLADFVDDELFKELIEHGECGEMGYTSAEVELNDRGRKIFGIKGGDRDG